jgi:hypothetical protein
MGPEFGDTQCAARQYNGDLERVVTKLSTALHEGWPVFFPKPKRALHLSKPAYNRDLSYGPIRYRGSPPVPSALTPRSLFP